MRHGTDCNVNQSSFFEYMFFAKVLKAIFETMGLKFVLSIKYIVVVMLYFSSGNVVVFSCLISFVNGGARGQKNSFFLVQRMYSFMKKWGLIT